MKQLIFYALLTAFIGSCKSKDSKDSTIDSGAVLKLDTVGTDIPTVQQDTSATAIPTLKDTTAEVSQ
jgi:hypothetical protein